jgi:multidrug efflux pump
MTLSELCIRRPVLATVVSLLIVVFGIAAVLQLPVRELPDVDRAVVSVTTTYTGAAPEIIDTDITELIEGAVAGVSGVREIRSESRRGRGRTTITFNVGRDIDQAANDVRDAVARVRNNLPGDADEPQILKSDSDADPVLRIGVVSDRMTPSEITDYIERFLVDRLATLDGVANVEINGQRRFAIRIWLDRRAMAARNLTVADIEGALRRNNLELPAGEVESLTRELSVRLDSRLQDVDAFRRIVVATSDGFPIRLGDVANVELGSEDESTFVRSDGRTAVGLNVLRQSQSNIIQISNAVRAELDALRPTLPVGMELLIGSDEAIFIRATIKEVLTALGIAMVLVVLVIFAFLMSARATLVPAVTIPVAVIGSFMLILVLGFSINVLTLLALILAIGLVVDDAIVMLENIQRRIDEGLPPVVASVLGAKQVTFAIIATSLTLIAVFVPLSFMQGAVGRLFVEFGLVLASAVVISTFVALTLCPALCSRVLKARNPGAGGPAEAGRFGRAVMNGYKRTLGAALAAPLPVIVVALLLAGTSFALYRLLPQELAPTEDRGVFFVPVVGPEGATVAYTDEQVALIEAAISPLLESGEAERIFAIGGMGGRGNRGFVVARLAEWGERDRSQGEIVRSLVPAISEITGVRAFPVSPAGLGLRGSGSPLRVVIGGPDFASVKEWGDAVLELAQENPNLENVDIDYQENQPQLTLRVDRDRADDLGIPLETIAQTLQTLLASREVTEFIDRGREYAVIVQAQREDRQSPTDLANIFVRSSGGELVPLGALVTAEEGAAAPELLRFDRLPAVTITASLADGYDLGTAIRFMEEVALDTLPPEARLGFAGQSREFLDASSGLFLTFGLALIIVFLVLAAQFESWVHPLIIMLSVPLAVAGALFSLWFTGGGLNVYSQIGIVLLIGLMAKNGILIVEFANQLRDQGMSVRDAVLEAAALRLRPIVMTVVSTVLGAVPLVIASGAGAESRIAIGTVIIGGLGLASILTLFLTPVLYDLLARFARPAGAVGEQLERELREMREREARAQPAE